jgi:hypothetical protein
MEDSSMGDGMRPPAARVLACVILLGLTTVAHARAAGAATAPPDFATHLVDTYRAEHDAAQALGQTNALTSVANYAQQVAATSPQALDALYAAIRQVPIWSQIPVLMQTVAAEAPSRGSGAGAARGGSVGAATAGVASVPAFHPANCSSGPPASAVFASQLVVDASGAVYNVASAAGSGGNKVALLTAALTAVVISAAAIVHDTLSFLRDDAASCAAANTAGYLASIDDVTTQTFGLGTSIGDAVTDLQTSAAGTAGVLSSVQSMVDDLRSSGEQLLQNQTSIQAALGGDIAALSTQLETDRQGLAADVARLGKISAEADRALGSAIAGATASIDDSVSSALAQVLDETDATAHALAQLVAGSTPQLMTALKEDRATARHDFEQNLKLDIEQGLASSSPQLRLKLPASVGGYLDAKPVGVQSVVESDIAALRGSSPQAAAVASQRMDEARAALAANHYFEAFADLRQSYLALTGA